MPSLAVRIVLYRSHSAENGRKGCEAPKRIRAEALEKTVWNFAAGLLSEPERIIVGLDDAIAEERRRLRTDPAREEAALLEQRVGLDAERDGFLRLAARGSISDQELDVYLNELTERRTEIDVALEHLRGRGERLRSLERIRREYSEPVAAAKATMDGWLRDYAEELADVSEAEYEAGVAMLAGDNTPERIKARRRANLDALGPDGRIARYRELRIRVDARSKDELTISGVFGSELVSATAASRS